MILTASDLPSINYCPPFLQYIYIFFLLLNSALHSSSIESVSEPLTKMGTCNIEIVPETIKIKVCLYFACNKDFTSCFKGHTVKACPFRDVPLLQNLRVWGGHRSSVSAFTATSFGFRFTVGTQTNFGQVPPPPCGQYG